MKNKRYNESQRIFIDKCMDLFKKSEINMGRNDLGINSPIPVSKKEECKFVALVQIAFRIFDTLSPREQYQILKCHRVIRLPDGTIHFTCKRSGEIPDWDEPANETYTEDKDDVLDISEISEEAKVSD
jgi:hypothetical protein